MKIEPFIHRCIARSGDMAGSKFCRSVDRWQVEAEEKCDNCGEVLATPEQILLHIYGELTE